MSLNADSKRVKGVDAALKYDIRYKPSYSMLVVQLNPGETITAESGAMTYMSPNIDVKTRMREKSLFGTLGLKFLGRQSSS